MRAGSSICWWLVGLSMSNSSSNSSICWWLHYNRPSVCWWLHSSRPSAPLMTILPASSQCFFLFHFRQRIFSCRNPIRTVCEIVFMYLNIFVYVCNCLYMHLFSELRELSGWRLGWTECVRLPHVYLNRSDFGYTAPAAVYSYCCSSMYI